MTWTTRSSLQRTSSARRAVAWNTRFRAAASRFETRKIYGTKVNVLRRKPVAKKVLVYVEDKNRATKFAKQLADLGFVDNVKWVRKFEGDRLEVIAREAQPEVIILLEAIYIGVMRSMIRPVLARLEHEQVVVIYRSLNGGGMLNWTATVLRTGTSLSDRETLLQLTTLLVAD